MSAPAMMPPEPLAAGDADRSRPSNALNSVDATGEEPKVPGGIRVSDSAVEFARDKLEKRGTPEAAVRLGIRGGGCSGFSYVIEFSDEPPRSRDTVYDYGGVRFYVDKKSMLYLSGSVLDYEQTLMFQGFKFRNPHEATSCGCGHSFTVK